MLTAFVVGNPRYPKWLRVIVAVGAIVLPFVVTFQLLNEMTTAQFAILVSFTMLMTLVALQADPVELPPRDLLVTVYAAAGGSRRLVHLAARDGHRRRAAALCASSSNRSGRPTTSRSRSSRDIVWITIVLVVVGAYLVSRAAARLPELTATTEDVRRRRSRWPARWCSGWRLLSGIAAWMPAIALLPMLAFLAEVPRRVRLALRLLVPIAILQMLHAYPVAGSQLQWGMVAVCVPAVIGIGAGLKRLELWRATGMPVRVTIVAALCVVIVGAAGIWPVTLWDELPPGRAPRSAAALGSCASSPRRRAGCED